MMGSRETRPPKLDSKKEPRGRKKKEGKLIISPHSLVSKIREGGGDEFYFPFLPQGKKKNMKKKKKKPMEDGTPLLTLHFRRGKRSPREVTAFCKPFPSRWKKKKEGGVSVLCD